MNRNTKEKKQRMKKVIIILTTIAYIGLSSTLISQERGTLSPISTVSEETKTKLKTIRTTAIFLNGDDALLTRILEDVLAIYLSNTGFNIINREKLEKSVGEQVAEKRKEKAGGAINALDIGKAVNANFILTGAVIIESEEKKSSVVKIATFQLVDVVSEKTLINVLFEPEKGRSFSEIAKAFVDTIKQNME